MKTIAVILAAGTGTRFGGNVPKQFLKINGKEILAYSLDTFSKCEKIDEIVLVINENFIEDYHKIMNQHLYKKIVALINGGETRQNSVENAIKYIAKNNDEAIVLVHDSARPFVSERIILDNIKAVKQFGCATTAVHTRDSVYITENGTFVKEVNRDDVYLAQTPQSALLSIFKKGFDTINKIYTDEAAIFAEIGYVPHIVLGDESNKKITYIEDVKNF